MRNFFYYQLIFTLFFLSECAAGQIRPPHTLEHHPSPSDQKAFSNEAEILKAATQFARLIENHFGDIEVAGRFEALREVALVVGKTGNQADSKALFNSLIEQIEEVNDISASSKKMQQKTKELNRGNSSFKGVTPDQNFWHLTRWKISALMDVGHAQMQVGQTAAAIDTFEKAVVLAELLPNEDRLDIGKMGTLMDIAAKRMMEKDREGAIATIEKASQAAESLSQGSISLFEWTKNFILMNFAWSQLEMGESVDPLILDKAFEIANENSDKWKSAYLFRDIAMLQARMGEREAALTTIEKLIAIRESVTDRDAEDILDYNLIDTLKVAESFIQAGRNEDAQFLVQKVVNRMRIINKNEMEGIKSSIWRKIAMVRAQMGDIQGAFEADKLVTDETYQGVAIHSIFYAQIKTGDLKGAQKTASIIKNASIFKDLSIAQARRGDIDGATATADLICCNSKSFFEAKLRAEALRAIAAARIEKGGDDSVSKWALSQPTPVEKTYALLGVAEGLQHRKAQR
ncbi:MAG: hypothetical protein MPW14_24985 (plasmid) [Candidatus Manganitrophus sp.]|nr:hypothetical protein [Candidatus Manganitrophus sp.]MDC4228175.1 hypothetical protein [Candidatus Manganitrophus sp.]WDT77726.1 MAG: hypothetical protein MPW16_20530 [Candidatus Manganitrophus sp.]WDT82871.1 MAG: hypothetical protein MPW14_24985 [Candidatus Manganitrophus sp.]